MMSIKTGVVGVVLGWSLAVSGLAQADVPTSREYKVLLSPSLFADQPKNASNAYLTDLKAALASAGFDRTVTGTFAKNDERTVRFYDSPGSCELRAQSYSFRERVDSKRESTLKFRSTSQSAAAGVTIKGSESGASSKFEVDKTASAVAYSRSTKQDFSTGKNLNKMKDVKDLYPTATGLSVTSDAPMAIVSGLTIYEKTYDGAISDIGQQSAEFSVSLWYLNASATTPAVAEASFKVEEKDGDFTTKVTQRSELIFTTMTQMSSWVAPTAVPKTNWVYQYNPSFCNSPAPAGSAASSTAMPF